MAKHHELRTCRSCGELVSVPVRKPAHVFHALMSIITFGVWIIVWLMAILEAAAAQPGKCPRCKGKVS